MDYNAKAVGGAYTGQVIGPKWPNQFQICGRVFRHPFQQILRAYVTTEFCEFYYWQDAGNRNGSYGLWVIESQVSENGVLK